jgi:hypothetical protein
MVCKRFLDNASRVKQVFVFLVTTLIIALAVAACSNNTEPLLVKYSGVKDGKTYELTITQSAANSAKAMFTPVEGDIYVLIITGNGGTQTSSGTVQTFSGNSFTLVATINPTVTFAVAISNSGIISIVGTITVQGGIAVIGPGAITPTGGTIPGGNTSTIPGGNTSTIPGGNTSGYPSVLWYERDWKLPLWNEARSILD